jgi:hypothetical protein
MATRSERRKEFREPDISRTFDPFDFPMLVQEASSSGLDAYENDRRQAELRTFHTESKEGFIDRIVEVLDHGVHRESFGHSLRSLCFNSVTSVRNSLPPSIVAKKS